MATRFRDRYKIDSARLSLWNYSSNGYYFLTICTKDRQHYFGEITENLMKISEIGKLAKKFWLEIPKHFPFVKLDEFIVMPDHVHGILIINNSHVVETQDLASLQNILRNN